MPSSAISFALLMLCFTGATAQSSMWYGSQEGSWSDRLGLHFRDDCQEETGIRGFFVWIMAWATRSGQQRSGHCESKEMRCAADTKITGLQVRYARLEQGDRDLYDFKPRCGTTWQSWVCMKLRTFGDRPADLILRTYNHTTITQLGMRFPRDSDHAMAEAAICPDGISMTGVQVSRGRNDRRDWDYYNFKLRCGKHWAEPMGLAFDGLRETRSATCQSGSWVAGLRVHRGFQDWGDLDTCTQPRIEHMHAPVTCADRFLYRCRRVSALLHGTRRQAVQTRRRQRRRQRRW